MVNGTRFFRSLVIVRQFSKPSYYHNPGSEPLRPLTIGKLLDISTEKWPDRVALNSVLDRQQLSFSEAKKKAEQLGAAFLKLGMKPGDRIAAFGGNTVHWYLTALAAAKAGLILTGLNPNYEKEELLFVLRHAGVKAIVSDSVYKGTDYYQLLSSVAPELPGTPSSSPLDSQALPDLKFVIIASEKTLPGTYRYNDVLHSSSSVAELESLNENLDPDTPFNIQFTSGTTGLPKAAVLSHFGTVNNAHFFGKRLGFHKQPAVICHQVPFFHVFGTVLGIVAAVDHGATIVLPGKAFNKKETVNALSKTKCTAIYGTPTMHIDVCSEIKREISNNNQELKEGLENFNAVITGGAFCTPQLIQDIYQTFNCKHVQSAYGMSETSPIVFTNTENDTSEQRNVTVGFVADHQEVKVVDSEGNMVPFGSPGEGWYRGYSTMLGYWNDENRTHEMITPSGWLKSGDQIVLQENGYGIVVGRSKDQINRGGEKIMPSEVEQVLETHPLLQEVHVHAVSDYRMGEEICACVRVADQAVVAEEDIKSYCKGKLARFKIPKYIKFMKNFPKTGTGKVKKNELRKMVEEGLEQEKHQETS